MTYFAFYFLGLPWFQVEFSPFYTKFIQIENWWQYRQASNDKIINFQSLRKGSRRANNYLLRGWWLQVSSMRATLTPWQHFLVWTLYLHIKITKISELSILPLPVSTSMAALMSVGDVISFRTFAVSIRESIPPIDRVNFWESWIKWRLIEEIHCKT